MRCPICKIKLDQSIFYGVEVDYCPKCLGVWFEEDELRLAKDNKDKDLVWYDVDLWEVPSEFRISRGERLCPACRLPLYEVYYGDSGVIVDVCNICYGIWLDRGEFRKIVNYLKERTHYAILNDYLNHLLEEAFEVFTGPETFKEEVQDFLAIVKVLNYKFVNQYPRITKLISILPK